jgi:uncharacterized protein (TIGR03118 family)
MVNIAVRAFAQGLTVASVGLLSLATALPAQQHYKQTNLLADTSGPGVPTDSNLVNPWGISRSSTSPWWVSDNGTGLATLYTGTGGIAPLVVTIPPSSATSGTGTPTGQIFNGTTDFHLKNGNPAAFIFVTEDGTISGWNGGTTAELTPVDTKSASVFKGIAIATINDPYAGPTNFLYVADFRKARVNVYDAKFKKVQLDGDSFKDERIPKGFAPFNVQNIGGNIYVAFAKQDSAKHDEVDGAGLGYVDVFSPTGRLLLRLQSGWWFNGPWGMAQAPSDFGIYSHDILVGQFGSGQILAFDPLTGRFKDTLRDSTNAPIVIDGLWAIAFGGGGTSGSATALFFTAGSDGEQHGLFGNLTAVENLLGGDH